MAVVWLACGGCGSDGHAPSDSGGDAGSKPALRDASTSAAADGGSDTGHPVSASDAGVASDGSSGASASTSTAHGGSGGSGGSGGKAGAQSGSGGAAAGGGGGSDGNDDEDGGLGEPPPPCGTPVDQIDLLFMVDNSNSMATKQAALRAQFPRMITALTSGGTSPIDGSTLAPVRDLHVGVVSSDMGIAGVEFGNCHADGGDDGRLQHAPRSLPGVTCDSSYPLFLSYDSAVNSDRSKLANDFSCIAALGTGGCGDEQQLEAPLKALWPATYLDADGHPVTPNPITFLSTTPAGELGRGDLPAAQGGNLGFLRRGSLLAIVLLTDEDDCSVRTTEHFWPPNLYPDDSPYKTEDINLRCFYNPQFSYDVMDRYYTGFRALRPGHESLVVFSAITGVPTDLVDTTKLHATDLSNDTARNAFFDDILNDPRMQERVDPSTMPGSGNGNLVPSCTRIAAGETEPSTAYPPRRIVQLAKAFGENGMVQSICQDDLSPAVDAIVRTISKRLDNACGQP